MPASGNAIEQTKAALDHAVLNASQVAWRPDTRRKRMALADAMDAMHKAYGDFLSACVGVMGDYIASELADRCDPDVSGALDDIRVDHWPSSDAIASYDSDYSDPVSYYKHMR